jgi:16S rRNA (cytosine967-C5)-methyltransferase
MIAPARVASYEILRSVSAGRSDLPTAIARARAGLHDVRDVALAAEIATGVQRWRAALDHLVVQFSKRPLDRLDPEVLDILRLGAYQFLHLTRVPASAVVNDAVHLTRRAGKSSAAGFVNGLLRSISRRRDVLPLPARPADRADRQRVLDYLSITLSHPRWLVTRWYDRFGFDATERWLQFNNTPAPLTLRANRLKVTPAELAARLGRLDIDVTPGRYGRDALIVVHGHPLRTAGIDEGWFVVQDEAAQLLPLLAGPPVERMLDTCAAPGGKTTALAAEMSGRGLLVACDVRSRRIQLLKRTVRASGATNVRIVQADLTRPLPFARSFHSVLVDVPCSGLGTLRRDPDIRWRRGPDDLPLLAAAQLRMLRHAAAAVAEGGRLAYATCSSEPEENEEVAAAFLERSPEFSTVDHAAEAPPLPREVIDQHGRFRTWPHLHGLEAFFGAVFTRR